MDAWKVEPSSFPMKLSVMLEGETCRIFDAASRDFMTEYITSRPNSVFFLENIPQTAEGLEPFRHNTFFREQKPEEIVYRKSFTDMEDVLNVRIEFEDSANQTRVAIISFPKEAVVRISFGIFLKKYGKEILDLFRGELGEQIPPYTDGPAFPMLLKFVDFLDSGNGFNNYNRDQTLIWNSNDNPLLLLCSVSGRALENLNAAVSQYAELPNCVICQAPLHHPVPLSVPHGEDLFLPELDHYNTTEFPCGHNFHTHCLIQAFMHDHVRCSLCRTKSEESWRRGVYSTSQHELRGCLIATYRQLRKEEKIENETEASNLRIKMSYIQKEFDFVSERTERDNSRLVLSDALLLPEDRGLHAQYTPPNLNGYQRLNLLLDRNLGLNFN